MPGFIDKYYALFVAYESMDFEKEEETLVCNSGNCFAAVGGNLGLLLGFSCLSIIYAAIDSIAMKLGNC